MQIDINRDAKHKFDIDEASKFKKAMSGKKKKKAMSGIKYL